MVMRSVLPLFSLCLLACGSNAGGGGPTEQGSLPNAGMAGTVGQVAAPLSGGQVRTIFVIAMENHNFAQPNPPASPQQILGNPAAPYINSLVTAGNANASQVSYATAYYNAGIHVHPSEPNYVWA